MNALRPTVFLSRDALSAAAGIAEQKLPLKPSGTTFMMAQEAAWLDSDHYAVGRWDGPTGNQIRTY